MFARRRGSAEPETSMEFKSEYCGLREMGLWFIQIQQSFQSVHRYTFIWCWFRRASGTWQEMAVWCVLEEIDGELGVLLKTCVFAVLSAEYSKKKKKTFPIRKSFLNESRFVLKFASAFLSVPEWKLKAWINKEAHGATHLSGPICVFTWRIF